MLVREGRAALHLRIKKKTVLQEMSTVGASCPTRVALRAHLPVSLRRQVQGCSSCPSARSFVGACCGLRKIGSEADLTGKTPLNGTGSGYFLGLNQDCSIKPGDICSRVSDADQMVWYSDGHLLWEWRTRVV